jgi:S1-C subfamily serine protease
MIFYEIHRDGKLLGTFASKELRTALQDGRILISDWACEPGCNKKATVGHIVSAPSKRAWGVLKAIAIIAVAAGSFAFSSWFRASRSQLQLGDAGESRTTPKPVLERIVQEALNAVFEVEAKFSGEKSVVFGTGFGLSAGGLVATNAHIIDGASKIIVKTLAGAEFKVKRVQYSDKDSDLAIIQLETERLPSLRLISKSTEVGTPVVVVGNPRGLRGSVSEGIVSAIRGQTVEKLSRLQLTAPISKGSSGSPVINFDGEVVGIVTAKVLGEEGLGFAVPASLIKQAIEAAQKSPKKQDDAFADFRYSFQPEIAEDPLVQTAIKANEGVSDALAINALTAAEGAHPRCIPLKLLLAQRYYSSGDWKAAAALYGRIIEIDPDNWKASLGLAEALPRGDDKWTEVRKTLEAAIRHNPLNFRARLKLAEKFDESEHHETVRQTSEAASVAPFHFGSVREAITEEATQALLSIKRKMASDPYRDPEMFAAKVNDYATLAVVCTSAAKIAVAGDPKKLPGLLPLLPKLKTASQILLEDAFVTCVMRNPDPKIFAASDVDDFIKKLRSAEQDSGQQMTAWRNDWSFPVWGIYPRLHVEFLSDAYGSHFVWRNYRRDPFDRFAAAAISDLIQSGKHSHMGSAGNPPEKQADLMLSFIDSYLRFTEAMTEASVIYSETYKYGRPGETPRSPIFELWIQFWAKLCLADVSISPEMRDKIAFVLKKMPLAESSVAYVENSKESSRPNLRFLDSSSTAGAFMEWAYISAKERLLNPEPSKR